jgi:hypothetical protein
MREGRRVGKEAERTRVRQTSVSTHSGVLELLREEESSDYVHGRLI